MMRRVQPLKRIGFGGVIVIGTALAGIAVAGFLAGGLRSPEPGQATWNAISWRAKLYGLKATGKMPELSWYELWEMGNRKGGSGLARVITDGVSPYGGVENPYSSSADREAGAHLFRERCATCHGARGTGGHAPSLSGLRLKHGNNDLAIYMMIRDGAMGGGKPTLSLMERWQVVGHVRALQADEGEGQASNRPLNVNVTEEQIRTAGGRPYEWLTYSGSLDGRRYAAIDELTPANVPRLQLKWVRELDTRERVESTPIVSGDAIFTTYPPANVIALSAASGEELWRYERNIRSDVPVCCGRVNRGLALLGSLLFFGSLDGYLVALDANSGQVVWETRVADPKDGFTLTGAPLIANRRVIVGVGGGEFGIRGFLAAYDAKSGQLQWRFSTIPSPGEFGSHTWENDAWRTGGGATWVTGSYDPSIDLVYWGVGNPAPDFAGHVRPGDNLFANSVIAVNVSTGKLAWHFQFTPHDVHDWDSNQTPILTDVEIAGRVRKVICWANRNGFYYLLDRVTGEFLNGVAFVQLSWARGLDSTGRPILSDEVESSLTRGDRVTRPGVGATNWQNAALDDKRGLIYVPAAEGAAVFTNSPNVRLGSRGLHLGSASVGVGAATPVVRAIEVGTGRRVWEYFSPVQRNNPYHYSGLLATAGGLLFGASGGVLFALDSDSGHELWRASLGEDSRAAPISFNINGRQVVAVSVGHSFFVFGQ